MTEGHQPSARELMRYLQGEADPSRAAEIARHVARCPKCQSELATLEMILAGLRAPSETVEQIDLVPGVHREIRAAQRPARQRNLFAPGLALAASLAVALPLLFWVQPFATNGVDPHEFRSKSTADHPDQWVGLRLYRVGPDGEVSTLHRRVRPQDGLLVAYVNQGPTPFEYLMVFGVQPSGRVFWYHPGYIDPGSNPLSIPITAATSPRELSEAITHQYETDPLHIIGLFTHQPYAVKEIEALLAEIDNGQWSRFDVNRLPVPDSGQHRITVEVK